MLQIGADSTVSGGVLSSGPLGTGVLSLAGGTLQDDGAGRTILNGVVVSGPVTLGTREPAA